MRLFLAGALVLLAGLDSDYDRAWVVTAFGIAMMVAALLRHPAVTRLNAPQRPHGQPGSQSPYAERISRERVRETRERRYRDDRAA